MPSYSMNIGEQGVEQDRTIEDYGFMGMTPHIDTSPPTAYERSLLGTPPGQLTSPLVNAVNPSGNTSMIDVGPSAHDLVVRRP